MQGGKSVWRFELDVNEDDQSHSSQVNNTKCYQEQKLLITSPIRDYQMTVRDLWGKSRALAESGV